MKKINRKTRKTLYKYHINKNLTKKISKCILAYCNSASQYQDYKAITFPIHIHLFCKLHAPADEDAVVAKKKPDLEKNLV